MYWVHVTTEKLVEGHASDSQEAGTRAQCRGPKWGLRLSSRWKALLMMNVQCEFSLWFPRQEGSLRDLRLGDRETSGFLVKERCWEWLFLKICLCRAKKIYSSYEITYNCGLQAHLKHFSFFSLFAWGFKAAPTRVCWFVNAAKYFLRAQKSKWLLDVMWLQQLLDWVAPIPFRLDWYSSHFLEGLVHLFLLFLIQATQSVFAGLSGWISLQFSYVGTQDSCPVIGSSVLIFLLRWRKEEKGQPIPSINSSTS